MIFSLIIFLFSLTTSVANRELGHWYPGTLSPNSPVSSSRTTQTIKDSSETFVLPQLNITKLHCMYNRHRPPQTYKETQSFIVRAAKECWEYCKLTQNCTLFSFQYRKRICALYNATNPLIEEETLFTGNFKLALGDMECLECLLTVDEVIAQSEETGVRIVDEQSRKCLGLTSSSTPRVKLANGKSGFRVAWKNCSNSNLWVLTRAETGYQDSYLVFLKGHKYEWSLEWNIRRHSHNIVYLAKSHNDTSDEINNQITLDRNLPKNGENCNYRIMASYNSDGKKPSHPKFYKLFTLKNGSLLPLSFVKFIRPALDTTCSLKKMSTKHGTILNKDKVPFLLAGSVITIKCLHGYGIKSLNFSIQQKVRCSEHMDIRPCSKIKRGIQQQELRPNYNVLIGIIVMLCSILIVIAVKSQLTNFCNFMKNYLNRPNNFEKEKEANM